MAKVKITQVRSSIKCPKIQRDTLKALGLSKVGKTVEQEYTDQIKGMVSKVEHLVKVEK